jgi:hypothetical protein
MCDFSSQDKAIVNAEGIPTFQQNLALKAEGMH